MNQTSTGKRAKINLFLSNFCVYVILAFIKMKASLHTNELYMLIYFT